MATGDFNGDRKDDLAIDKINFLTALLTLKNNIEPNQIILVNRVQ